MNWLDLVMHWALLSVLLSLSVLEKQTPSHWVWHYSMHLRVLMGQLCLEQFLLLLQLNQKGEKVAHCLVLLLGLILVWEFHWKLVMVMRSYLGLVMDLLALWRAFHLELDLEDLIQTD